MHFTDWGEIFVNTSSFKSAYSNLFFLPVVFITAGVISLLYFMIRLYSKNGLIPGYIKTYTLLYILVVFCWPTIDARFWVPVLPILFSILLQKRYIENKYERIAGKVWKSAYVLLGTIALGYFTWMSYDKAAFSTRHDTGIWARAYELYFSGREPGISEEQVRYPLHLLREYDR